MMIQLRGRITEEGELRVKLPAGIPAGEVDVMLLSAEEPSASDTTWTDEELTELFTSITPAKSGAEIVAWLESIGGGGWEDQGITDSDEWVEAQRLKNRRQFPSW
jgi:hypothetical protein